MDGEGMSDVRIYCEEYGTFLSKNSLVCKDCRRIDCIQEPEVIIDESGPQEDTTDW